jgi:hypothetical protein
MAGVTLGATPIRQNIRNKRNNQIKRNKLMDLVCADEPTSLPGAAGSDVGSATLIAESPVAF